MIPCARWPKKQEPVNRLQLPEYFKEKEQAENGVRLTFKEGAVTNYVLTLLAAGEGKQIPVSFNAAIFRDITGNVKGIFASARYYRPKTTGRKIAGFPVIHPFTH